MSMRSSLSFTEIEMKPFFANLELVSIGKNKTTGIGILSVKTFGSFPLFRKIVKGVLSMPNNRIKSHEDKNNSVRLVADDGVVTLGWGEFGITLNAEDNQSLQFLEEVQNRITSERYFLPLLNLYEKIEWH